MSKHGVGTDIAANAARIRERIDRAAERVGRRPEDIRLVAVSKLHSAERISEAIGAGIKDIGENYVQEAAAKHAEVPEGARWHMVGHLQRNKAKQAVQIFDMVQTVDSSRLAAAIGRHAEAAGGSVDILLQVNTSGESAKSGVAPDAVEKLLEAVSEMRGLRVQGLMTIGRWDPNPESARSEFRLLADLAGRLADRGEAEMKWVSMGMSHDFEIAIEEGANLVRVGTGIFGSRPE